MAFHQLEVGQPFPFINQIPKAEGTSLNFTEEGSLCTVIRYRNFSSQEKREIKSGVVQFRFIQNHDLILLLARFGTLPPIELPFDPSIYSKHGTEFKVQSNSLSVYAVDHASHKLVAMRVIGLHQDFLNHFLNIWYRNCCTDIFNQFFRVRYQIWLDELFGQFTTNKLWEMATPIDWRSGDIQNNKEDKSLDLNKPKNLGKIREDELLNDPKLRDCLKKAKETGNEIEFASWLEFCQDPKEECSFDAVSIMITPNDEKIITRHHMY